MDISKNITSVREKKGLKQSDIADKMGIDQPNYSRLEKRGNKLSVEQLISIAMALDVPLSQILSVENPSEKVRIQELEKRGVELEERVKDKQSIIDSFDFDVSTVLEGLGADIINFFSVDKFPQSVSPLYKLKDETPYCYLIRNEETKRQIVGYLNFKSKESEFIRSFYLSDLFDMDELFKAMDNYNFVAMNKEKISTIVDHLMNTEWEEMAKEDERIANDPKTQKRIESMREFRKKNDLQ